MSTSSTSAEGLVRSVLGYAATAGLWTVYAVVGLYVLAHVIQTYMLLDLWLLSKRKGISLPKNTNLDFLVPLGFRRAYTASKHFKTKTLLEYLRDQFAILGDTSFNIQSGQPVILTIDPENVKAILATQFKDFDLGFRYPLLAPLLGNGIFTLSGEGWRHSRTLLRPQFSREQVSRIKSVIEHVDSLIERFDDGAKRGEFVDAQELFHGLTLDAATEFLFGESTGVLEKSTRKVQGPEMALTGVEFGEAFNNSQIFIAKRRFFGSLMRFYDSAEWRLDNKKCKNFIDYFVLQALEKPMERDEVAEKYVFIRELTKETRDAVVIRDQALNILLAGRDTTAATASFLALYLARNKRVWHKLREAVLEDFGTGTENISFETLKHCKYLGWVLNEILRLHPIVPSNFRQAVRTTTLPRGGGPNGEDPMIVPKGYIVAYSVFVMQRQERYWGETVDEFNPERWATEGSHGWDYLPFNGGPRICLGQQFALTELGVTFVRLCQTYRDLEVQSELGDLRRMQQELRLTSSVHGGVPIKWIR